jgi:hypothetical protein
MADGVFWLLMLACIIFFYWLPTLVAWRRDHTNVAAIAVTNFFLGWTFIGWVVALIWAFTRDVKEGRR